MLSKHSARHPVLCVSSWPWIFHLMSEQRLSCRFFIMQLATKPFPETMAGASVSCMRIIRKNVISAHKWEMHDTYADYAKGICIPCRNQSRKAECGMLWHQLYLCVSGHPSLLLLLCACLHMTPKALQILMLVWQKLASILTCKCEPMNMKICCILKENAFEGSAEIKASWMFRHQVKAMMMQMPSRCTQSA